MSYGKIPIGDESPIGIFHFRTLAAKNYRFSLNPAIQPKYRISVIFATAHADSKKECFHAGITNSRE